MLNILRLVRSLILIYLCLFAGNLIASILPFPIPASIIGMIVLFLLLAFNILPSDWIKFGCQLFIRYMAVLFVPASIGIIKYYDLLIAQVGPIVISSICSTLIVMLTIGFLAQYIEKSQQKNSTGEQL